MKESFTIIGFVLLVGGCAFHYAPLAGIVGGAIMLSAGCAAHFYRGVK